MDIQRQQGCVCLSVWYGKDHKDTARMQMSPSQGSKPQKQLRLLAPSSWTFGLNPQIPFVLCIESVVFCLGLLSAQALILLWANRHREGSSVGKWEKVVRNRIVFSFVWTTIVDQWATNKWSKMERDSCLVTCSWRGKLLLRQGHFNLPVHTGLPVAFTWSFLAVLVGLTRDKHTTIWASHSVFPLFIKLSEQSELKSVSTWAPQSPPCYVSY